jgi:hypothetical protein
MGRVGSRWVFVILSVVSFPASWVGGWVGVGEFVGEAWYVFVCFINLES